MPPHLPPPSRNFLILICLGCEASIRVRRGDLPEKCYICMEQHGWRVALDHEYTVADQRLLKSLRISQG